MNVTDMGRPMREVVAMMRHSPEFKKFRRTWARLLARRARHQMRKVSTRTQGGEEMKKLLKESGFRQTPADRLISAANLFEERNRQYGANYKRMGALVLALFPEGGVPPVTTELEGNRLRILLDCASKLQRYAHNFAKGGHLDSARDLQVYAAMLEEFTE